MGPLPSPTETHPQERVTVSHLCYGKRVDSVWPPGQAEPPGSVLWRPSALGARQHVGGGRGAPVCRHTRAAAPTSTRGGQTCGEQEHLPSQTPARGAPGGG